MNAIDTKAPVIINTASGDIATFDDGADGMPIKHLVANIEAVQSGTGDPSPENIRPISGWAGLTGQACGKNLSKANTIEGVGWATENSDLLESFNNLRNGTYVIRIKATVKTVTGTTTSGWMFGGIAISPAGNVNFQLSFEGEQPVVGMVKTFTKTFTINDSNRGSFTSAYVYGCGNNQQGALGTSDLTEIQIELGTASSDFEPYQGDTISVSWATEAGTVYGGTLDVVTGELTVTWVADTVNGDSALSYNGTYTGKSTEWQYVPQTSKKNGEENIKSDRFYASNNHHVGSMLGRTANGNIYFSLPENIGSSVSDAKDWFASNPTQVIYELAIPIVYQLDLITVSTLLGNNTIYVDCGSVTVDYPVDTGIVVAEQSKPIIGVPIGGVSGQVLGKTGTEDDDIAWVTLSEGIQTIGFAIDANGILNVAVTNS